jgi:hypothetical protein
VEPGEESLDHQPRLEIEPCEFRDEDRIEKPGAIVAHRVEGRGGAVPAP